MESRYRGAVGFAISFVHFVHSLDRVLVSTSFHPMHNQFVRSTPYTISLYAARDCSAVCLACCLRHSNLLCPCQV
ncbi:hypothetical protein BDU57DRAFT_523002 [Ampelomyces quisqualis]|uniref:Uncharacterized protein n=1 Tax=Ampelomyces quisqualis TaxID=50730 RepID=A0A6A5QAG3_AMPQU|nr:hypothetical protein BDU57DRAFT_523002 [Ampelomyces quisqualis]